MSYFSETPKVGCRKNKTNLQQSNHLKFPEAEVSNDTSKSNLLKNSWFEKNFDCEIFNLGNHKSEKLMDLIRMIENYLGKKAKIDFQPMQPGDVSESFAEIKKSTELLNYQPTTNIKEGIPKFIDWYKNYYK